MIRFFELMFYVIYLRIRQNDGIEEERRVEAFLLLSTLWAVSLIGFLLLTGVMLMVGVMLDVKVFEFLLRDIKVGAPMMFLGPAVTALFYYCFSVRGGKYLKYSEKYPEVTSENLRRYDQNYMMWPVVFSFLFLCFSVWVTFATGRGV